MRTGSVPVAVVIVRSLEATAGSGAVDLPCFASSFIAASAGVGCLRASAAVSVGIGFGPSAASWSSTPCIWAVGFAIACGVVVPSIFMPTSPDDVSPIVPSFVPGEQAVSAIATPPNVSVVRANRTIVFPIIIPSPPHREMRYAPRHSMRGRPDTTARSAQRRLEERLHDRDDLCPGERLVESLARGGGVEAGRQSRQRRDHLGRLRGVRLTSI